MMIFATRFTLAAALLATGGCAASTSLPEPGPAPLAAQPTIEAEAAPEPVLVAEPETPLSERWRSPFGVTSDGAVQPRTPRIVTVLGADTVAPRTAPGSGGRGAAPTAAGQATAQAGTAGSAAPRPQAAGPRPAPTAASAAVGARTGATAPGELGTPVSLTTSSSAPGASPAPAVGGRQSATAAPRPVPAPSTPAGRPPAVGPSAAAADASTPADGGPRPRTYRVERGDSWLRIAINHGVSYSQLAASNPGVEPDRIRIGQILQIPQVESTSARRSHRVGPGDTLWGIARRYDISPEDLRSANGLDSDRIRQGQVLVIPAAE